MSKNFKCCLIVLCFVALTLFAGCNFIPSNKKEYTVSFDSNGGTTVESRTVEENATTYKPRNPEKTGYVFDAWYYDDQRWNFSTQRITKDITLVAKWHLLPSDGIVYLLNDDYTAYYVGDYLGSATDVVISDTYRGLPVTEIGSWAFSSTDVRSVRLPNTITRIRDCAFPSCHWISDINFPASLLEIDAGAFQNCDRLTTVVIPKSVKKIGSSNFIRCSWLTKIEVESGNAFYDSRNNCNAIIETQTNTLIAGCKNSEIPNNVAIIGDGAFEGKGLHKMVEIPKSVKEIGNLAFASNSFLAIIIPNSVTKMGSLVFDDCLNLTIYCEASSRPKGWSTSWNNDHNQVVWNYVKNN
ncbi:MAG: leucine-rich repeat protein [Clostridia bacterium]|jgi:uncharacterized repeat protein (TIGR02543 family)|nr:leucine-rich repeat protein [Clostridia bacterium]